MAALPDALIRLKRAIPRFEFGREEETRAAMSPVSTYYLVVVPALVLTVFGLLMGFSAQAVTAIAAGENPYIAYLRPLIIIVAAAVIAAFVHAAPVALVHGEEMLHRFHAELVVGLAGNEARHEIGLLETEHTVIEHPVLAVA